MLKPEVISARSIYLGAEIVFVTTALLVFTSTYSPGALSVAKHKATTARAGCEQCGEGQWSGRMLQSLRSMYVQYGVVSIDNYKLVFESLEQSISNGDILYILIETFL